MDQKKRSETLEQRRKVQREFIELKRMQAENKNNETEEHIPYKNEIKPKGFKAKFAHFWYYYKFPVITLLLAAVVITVSCVQCARKEADDLRVVIFSNHYISDNQTADIENYFEEICADYNNDGVVKVTCVNCTFETNVSPGEYQQTKMQKLQSLIAIDTKAMIFVTTKETYKYINELDEGGLLGEYFKLGDDFYSSVSADITIDPEKPMDISKDLVVSVRKIQETAMEKDKTAKEYNSRANEFFENLKKTVKNRKSWAGSNMGKGNGE